MSKHRHYPLSRSTATALVVLLTGASVVATGSVASAAVTTPSSNLAPEKHGEILLQATKDPGPVDQSDPFRQRRVPTQAQLVLIDPDGRSTTVDSTANTASAEQMEYSFNTLCFNYGAPCDAPALNGVWRVNQTGAGASSGPTISLRFRAPVPVPSAALDPADDRTIIVTWTRGNEPDRTGWTVYDGEGAELRRLGPGDCPTTTCTTRFTYGPEQRGKREFAVAAFRKDPVVGEDAVLSSGLSDPTSATLPAPPPPPAPEPTPGGTTGGSSTGGSSTGGSSTGGSSTGGGSTGGSSSGGATSGSATGGSATGGQSGAGGSTGGFANKVAPSRQQTAALAARRNFALSFKAFAPKLGIPKLAPLPVAPAPAIAGAGDFADDEFGATLGYEDQTVLEKFSEASAPRRVTGAIGDALDSAQLAKSIASSLILLLAFAHLRRWLAVSRDDQP